MWCTQDFCCYCVPCGSTITDIGGKTYTSHIKIGFMETAYAVISVTLAAFYDLDLPQYQIPPMPIV